MIGIYFGGSQTGFINPQEHRFYMDLLQKFYIFDKIVIVSIYDKYQSYISVYKVVWSICFEHKKIVYYHVMVWGAYDPFDSILNHFMN